MTTFVEEHLLRVRFVNCRLQGLYGRKATATVYWWLWINMTILTRMEYLREHTVTAVQYTG